MATSVGEVSQVVGTVVAIDASGNERVLSVGDEVFAGETLRTGDNSYIAIALVDGGRFDLGRNGEAVLDSDVVNIEPEGAPGADEGALSVESIQAAIAAGVDPTQLLPATAAGPAAGGPGGGPDGAGHSFVILPPGLTEGLPGVPDFATQGFGVNFGELPGTREDFPEVAEDTPPPEDGDKEDGDKEDTDKEDGDKEDTDKEDGDKEDTNKEDGDKEDTDKEDGDKEDTDKEDTDKEDTDKEDTDKEDTDKEDGDKEDGDKPEDDTPNDHAISDVNFYFVDEADKLTVVKLDAYPIMIETNEYDQPQVLEAFLENYPTQPEWGDDDIGDLVGYSVKAGGDMFHYVNYGDEGWKLVAYSEDAKGNNPDVFWTIDLGYIEGENAEAIYTEALYAYFPEGATPDDQKTNQDHEFGYNQGDEIWDDADGYIDSQATETSAEGLTSQDYVDNSQIDVE